MDIYATSVDYNPRTEVSTLFFKTVQNKMHWAAHGQTAAEKIYYSADALVAKNNCTEEELSAHSGDISKVEKDYIEALENMEMKLLGEKDKK